MTTALFPEPEHVPHKLSRMYESSAYIARKTRKSRYIKYSGKEWCQECFALQHEQLLSGRRGDLLRVRAQATNRRVLPDGTEILLCGAHAVLWRERDAGNVASK